MSSLINRDALRAAIDAGSVTDRLTALGYTGVRAYREGIEDWVNAGLPTESG
jgi:rhodanese-related sulfurtransferase